MTRTNYQPYIDGLRAIAVVSVVIYHLGLGILPGGFVGVDVFFVISGFLISRIIFADVEQARFSFLRFYERRVRRIAPAFLAVTSLTFVGVYLFSLPPEFSDFARSVIAALCFVPNIYFYENSGYFSPCGNEYSFTALLVTRSRGAVLPLLPAHRPRR